MNEFMWFGSEEVSERGGKGRKVLLYQRNEITFAKPKKKKHETRTTEKIRKYIAFSRVRDG